MANRRGTLDVALWIAAVPVGLAAVRLMMFSQGDATLLRVLLETLQVLPILIAATLQVIPWVVLVTGVIFVFNASSRRVCWEWLQVHRYVYVAVFIGAVTVLYVTAVPMLVAILIIYGIVLTLVIISRTKKPWAVKVTTFTKRIDNDEPLAAFLSILILPLLLSQLTAWNTFWLPREAVTVAGEVTDVYVLSVTSEWTTLLTPDREILRYRTKEITDRIVCDQGKTLTLLTLSTTKEPDPAECEGPPDS